ncbi:ABC transporter substrate-binding protein [bacterium]|nr:ABC transporter substrate-binding protein [bacterium]
MVKKGGGEYKKIIFFLIYIGVFFIGKTEAISLEKTINIYVVKSLDIKPYNDALRGFFHVLEEKGYIEGENLVLGYYLLKGRKDIKNIVKNIKQKNPDLILTAGTEATKKILEAEIKDIPVIFLMVLDPKENGFVESNQRPGKNFTGTTMKISAKMQLKAIKSVIPEIKKVGVIYNPDETGKLIKGAVSFSKKNKIELKAVNVFSPKEIPDVLNVLIKEIELLWIVPDEMVISEQSLSYMLEVALKSKVPVMGYAAHVVRKGALLALSCDYEDIGCQGGELFCKVIKGEKTNNLAVTVPRKAFLSVNLRVAKQVGIEIPARVLKEAYKVFN